MLVIEAMALRRPVLVNGHCPVLRELADRGPSVFAYRGKKEFFAHLTDILQFNWQSHEGIEKLATSENYTQNTYSWQRVMAVYQHALSARAASHV
mgnify:CR=1 FL=1